MFSVFLSSEIDLNYDVAIELKPYGGLIGIENSSLDKYLKGLKI